MLKILIQKELTLFFAEKNVVIVYFCLFLLWGLFIPLFQQESSFDIIYLITLFSMFAATHSNQMFFIEKTSKTIPTLIVLEIRCQVLK